MAAKAEHFVPRLSIVTDKGSVRTLAPLWPEQWRLIDTFQRYEQMVVVKPRQMGSTTVLQALLFCWAYWAVDPISILTVGHEQGACFRVNSILRRYAQQLPLGMRPVLDPDNSQEIGMGEDRPIFRQLMAGGRGQGRSYTYQCVAFTEAGKYPKGSSVTASGDGTTVDEDVVASVLSTVHRGPYRKVIFESTGDGPGGVFHKYAKLAHSHPDWGFLDFKWFDFPHYALPVPDEFIRTPEEEDLVRRHGVSDSQLQWKREKLGAEGYTKLRFRREYPEHWEEPFLPVEEGAYLDVEMLNRVLARIPEVDPTPLYEWSEYDPTHQYGIGVDTSGGTGRDSAAIYVVRDDLEIAARWFTNLANEERQAEMAIWLSNRFGRARILCEANKYGRAVIDSMTRLGARLWKDPESGKDWWTQAGRAGNSKILLFAHLRRWVMEGVCCSAEVDTPPLMLDPLLVKQLLYIREDDHGRIEAPEGQHDDLAFAYALALWCVRGYHERQQKAQSEEAALRRDLRQVLHGN